MANSVKDIAKRIKDLRTLSDFTEKEVADLVGISLEKYNRVESGEMDIPIGLLYNIAAALQIDPTVLITGGENEIGQTCVVYDGQGVEVERYPGYSFTSLASKYSGRTMEPMIVDLKFGIEPELVRHKGQEFNYVLSGKLRVVVGGRDYYLRAGDSIFFDPTIPHAQIAMETDAKFLTVIMD